MTNLHSHRFPFKAGPQPCNRIAGSASEQIADAMRGHRERPPIWSRRLWRKFRNEITPIAEAVAALERKVR